MLRLDLQVLAHHRREFATPVVFAMGFALFFVAEDGARAAGLWPGDYILVTAAYCRSSLDQVRLVLAFDGGSPLTSVAVARGGVVIAEDAVERAGSSDSLLALIDAVLGRSGGTRGDLGAICVLAGPGSFTGLRIGLATALGLHQALGVRAAAMPTLRVLAEASGGVARRVIAVVDAMRGEWFAQVFVRGPTLVEEGAARILRPAPFAALEAEVVIGFGASRLAEDGWGRARSSAAAGRGGGSARHRVAELGPGPAHHRSICVPPRPLPRRA